MALVEVEDGEGGVDCFVGAHGLCALLGDCVDVELEAVGDLPVLPPEYLLYPSAGAAEGD